MEGLIVFVWFLLVLVLPVCLSSVAYYYHDSGTPAFGIIIRLIASIAIHLLISWALILPMFIVIFAGAHTEPVGNALSMSGRFILMFVVILHGIAGWLLCCFVALKFIFLSRYFAINDVEAT